MAEEEKAPAKTAASTKAAEATAKRAAEAPAKAEAATAPPEAAEKKPKKSAAPKAPRRPTLEPELARLLGVRDAVDARRPKFVRTASHRYWRIGRWASWRRPRGLQSKQRRHYGYRPVVVSIGFRSPRRTRGLTPSGFAPVIVRTSEEIQRLDRTVEAALIAGSVGTRRRLVLEETARKLGIHVLNPITSERKEE
jgi:large subunit ribosomal protein L32e